MIRRVARLIRGVYRKSVFFIARGGFFEKLRSKKLGKKIVVGSNFWAWKGARVGGNVVIGDDCTLHRYASIGGMTGEVVLGDRVSLGSYNRIIAGGRVTIGDDVLFADHVRIVSTEHIYEDINRPIWMQGNRDGDISIGEGTWSGMDVTILMGTTIGRNCVIGAGSVVKGIFPDYCVIAGNPAKVIKKYNQKTNTWEKVH